MRFPDKQHLLKQFLSSDEKLMFSKVLDQVFLCLTKGEETYTDFLDPARATEFTSVIERDDKTGLSVLAYGGGENSERRILGFSLGVSPPVKKNFPISILEISYNSRFSRTLSHRDFLGSVLSLGLEREKIGDIVVLDAKALCYVHSDIAAYICANMERVANTKVTVKETEFPNEEDTQGEAVEERITVSSLRLDSVISACFHLSRGKSAGLIAAEKVFVNWKIIDRPARQLVENDVVTLRGYGRIRINEVVGKTKKDRLIINVSKTK